MGECGKEPPPDISLRPFRLSDVDAFMEWAMDDRVSRLCRWETYSSRDDCISFMVSTIIPHPWCRAICIEDRPIGAVKMRPKDPRSTAELSYELAFRHWGKGIATRAVKMTVSAIFRDLPELESLEALAHAENEGSIRVLEKVGFELECIVRGYPFKGTLIDLPKFRLVRGCLKL